MLLAITALLFIGPLSVQAQQPGEQPAPTVKVPVESPATPAQKKGLTTDLFEKDEDYKEAKDENDGLKSLTAKVKVVREESDGVEVFFEGDKNTGTFFLHRAIPHYAKILKDLEKSKKPQGPPVSISYTEDKKIKKVELKTEDTGKVAPKNPNEKWDLSL
ncbi:hypothetical protein AZI86_00035 [Bdellovibrio bacteriovorus]|uniref:Uncharacterized protein n=1 Tax=Bdellovibrio bacteriovorus TaxID=959 RepID=A0A150WMT1_BDEBC|nr:hypothetical protein [Bdellovibrio bacteriovorus]KYG65505.1 hypothetical protein AZI86_00035 [Bdellovibrio bacteriovorus]